MTGFRERTRPYAELCKLRISLSATLSSAAGFLLAGGMWRGIGIPLAGVFLLAAGASGLNQYQERRTDALMPRTRKRPLPSGRIEAAAALLFSVSLLSAGLLLLGAVGSAACVLGLIAVLWYNGLYTSLKRRTAFAVLPGAVTGALPVATGWVSAGGNVADPKLLFLCFFFFMWQIPHFWLFAGGHGREYSAAGLPSVTSFFSESQMSRINFIWISAAGVSCIFLAEIGVIKNNASAVILAGLSLWVMGCGAKLLLENRGGAAGAAVFGRINVYMVVVSAVLAADRFI